MTNCAHLELNFPNDPGAGDSWIDPANGIEYVFDGYKWDVYVDKDDAQNHWVRDDFSQRLTPRDPDDTIRTRGYEFYWLENLRNAPKGKG